jgi:serine/threonine-protein kinase
VAVGDAADPSPDSLIGRSIAGRYTVVRRIGKGAIGAIYEVRHTKLDRRFAMKTLAGDFAEDPDTLARFRREADVIAKLRHPNIVDIVDWDVTDAGAPYLVMELLRGENLALRLKRTGPMPWPIIGRVIDEMLAALTVAHRAGVVHRDLKPHNIFLAVDDAGDERVKLLDFGVSKVRGGQVVTSVEGAVIGTPAYMSPEQAEGRADVGPEADVWSTGAILYEMVTGQRAFRAPTIPALMYAICHGHAPPIGGRRPDAPPLLEDIVGRALSRDPKRRLASAEQMRSELREALRECAPGAFTAPMRAVTATARTEAVEPGVSEFDETVVPSATARELITTLGSATGESVEAKAPPPRRRTAILVAALGVVLAAAVAVLIADRDGDEAAAVSPPAPATAPPPAPDAAPSHVLVEIASVPPGATVVREADQLRLGTTPFSQRIARGRGTVTLRLDLAGYERKSIVVPGDRPTSLTVTLLEEPAPERRRRERKPRAKRRKGEPIDPYR